MKSRRRHELKQNVLGAELGKVIKFLKKRGSLIAWGILAASLITLIAVWSYKGAKATQRELLDEFDSLVSGGPGTNPQQWLQRMRALADQDKNQRLAVRASVEYADRCAAQGLTDQADSYYRRVISDFSDQPTEVAKAHLGLGKLAESERRFDDAQVEYEAVRRMIELTDAHPLVIEAERCLDAMERLRRPVRMAATAPAEPTTQPAEAEPKER